MIDILNPGYDSDRYPASIQSFELLRQNNMVYVDKTAYIYRLTRTPQSYFLSRPRRFGKSLMLSTIHAFFEGRRELFEGLAIYDLEQDWKSYPVIHISLGSGEMQNPDKVVQHLDFEINRNAERLSVILDAVELSDRFSQLITRAYDKYNTGVVVLIDEYDKPLQETMHTEGPLLQAAQELLRGFYGCIKECNRYLRFVMITGVTKFGHVNIFSGLNNLIDLSLIPWCNAICGISQSEMQHYFTEDIATLGKLNGMSAEQCATKIKEYYDGYRFAGTGENIYNPYSVMNAFARMQFDSFWFQTGTPYSLIKTLAMRSYNLENLEGTTAHAQQLMGIRASHSNPVGLLYQTGYLTIKNFDDDMYTLGFPNREVSSGFYNDLLDVIYHSDRPGTFSAWQLLGAAKSGDAEQVVQLLQKALATYNYDQLKDVKQEAQFNMLLQSVCMAVGLTANAEVHMASGRIDMVIETKRYVYLFEFKINSTAAAALRQINSKGYKYKFAGDHRKLFKIGMNIDPTLRQITDYVIQA